MVFDELEEYFKQIRQNYQEDDYTEYTNRTPLENLVTSIENNYQITQEPPRQAELGAPDFKAAYQGGKVGYIETKDLGKNLDKVLESEQLGRYQESIDNLILTDYARFILIRNGEPIFDFNLFNISDLEKNSSIVSEEKAKRFLEMLTTFFEFDKETIKSAEELAHELSKKTKLLRDAAHKQLKEDLSDDDEDTSSILQFHNSLKELVSDVEEDYTANAYAETITYGLFLASIQSEQDIRRETAHREIPQSIGVIKRIFVNITGDSLPSNVSWIVDEIVSILNATDVESIVEEMDFRGKNDRDPFTFFYEDFLSSYDPERRKNLGVYYTPRPVVSFIANSVNQILKSSFDKDLGYAEDDVTVLDPATGTGTFLWLVYLITLGELKDNDRAGLIPDKIENHVLEDFYGIELQITPYIISHLKLGMVLKKWYYDLEEDDRVQTYLSNTLEPQETHGLHPFLKELTEESRVANELKTEKDILAILGNPPYSGFSANQGEWITNLLKEGYERADGTKDDGYYTVDGEPLDEKNPKWLQDDYVKFIRFAQWKIDRTGQGVVGYITNHNYLDNPTFRGMRESLYESFDRIFIINLHGNSLKQEKPPEGGKDENVFDIRPGVAIALFVKKEDADDTKILYNDLWGSREEKYRWLDTKHPGVNNMVGEDWEEVEPKSPDYLFVPRNYELEEQYQNFWKITDIFQESNPGIVTARDSFTIMWNQDAVWEKINDFVNLPEDEAREKYELGEDSDDWKVKDAQEDLEESGPNKENITSVLYRPFDERHTYYTGNSGGFHCRPRHDIMRHMEKENLGLCIGRQGNVVGAPIYDVIMVTDNIVDFNLFRRGGELLFPLYLYGEKQKNLKNHDNPQNGKQPNLNPEFVEEIEDKYGETSPKKIFHYIYAILQSRTYRKKYEEFLDTDFPRIPFIDDKARFKEIASIGKELTELHLMKEKLETSTTFNEPGNNRVETIRYRDGENVFINDDQYFGDIPEEIWELHIGGYQVLKKWLRDRRRERKDLTSEEVEQFMQNVEIIRETIRLQEELEEKAGFV